MMEIADFGSFVKGWQFVFRDMGITSPIVSASYGRVTKVRGIALLALTK
jgi:hypothetical protein